MLRSSRTHALALAAFVLFAGGAAGARQYLNSGSPPGAVSMGIVPEVNDQAVSDANPLPVKPPSGGLPTTPSGVTRARLTCTLPAYATGGNITCTDQAGAQTTTACAANTACLVSAANANRKTALATVRTASVTCDVGYSATVAPGNAVGIDGSAASGGQGGSLNETPAHVGTYYAACPSAATLVFVQGQ